MFAAAAAAAILLSSAVAVASASPVDGAGGTSIPSIKGLLDKNNLPTTGQDWISLGGDKSGSGLEYQPNDFGDEDPETARHLRAIRDRALLSFGSGHYSKQFIDGSETYYDEYSQAWRLLGFYVDCNSPYVHQGDCGGGGEEDDDGQQNEIQYDANGKVIKNCVRYLLWAAVSKNIYLLYLVLRYNVLILSQLTHMYLHSPDPLPSISLQTLNFAVH